MYLQLADLRAAAVHRETGVIAFRSQAYEQVLRDADTEDDGVGCEIEVTEPSEGMYRVPGARNLQVDNTRRYSRPRLSRADVNK